MGLRRPFIVKLATEQTASMFADLTQLTDEAGQALRSIWVRVAWQAKEIEAIARKASWQESVAGKTAAMVQKLVVMAKQMGQIAHVQNESASNLTEVSQVLQASVAAFQLPAPSLSGLPVGRAQKELLPAPDPNSNNPAGRESGSLYRRIDTSRY